MNWRPVNDLQNAHHPSRPAMKQVRNISGLVKYMNTPDLAKQAAAKAGLLKFQGSDCKYGHGGIRYTKTGQCVDCIPMYRDLKKEKNNEQNIRNSQGHKVVQRSGL